MTSPAEPGVETGIDTEKLKRLLPPFRVILHNDDHNSMDHVVRSLMKSVPSLGRDEAARIMMEAHNHGKATVIICTREEAELYRDRLQSFGLTATIDQA
jgi:ATP-dependent Clp protease adaptor protein ClpS